MYEISGVFVAGVVLGAVFIGLVMCAWAWDKGFAAGSSWAMTVSGREPFHGS